jgi:beta-lactam-binding protein with PASTA domain
VDTATGALSALRRLGIVIAIAAAFLFGLATTVYLSLRSPEVTVPDIVGKDRFEAEQVLGDAGLNFRVRATRPSNELKADTVLFQLPRAGEIVKAGQTVAMDISRMVKEGESSEAVAPEKKPEEKAENANTSVSEIESKPRRNKNTNKNANETANSNADNRNANETANSNADNRNANANSNRPAANKNANSGNSNAATNGNSNRPALNINNNSKSNVNQDDNRRPPVAKPSPTATRNRENP